MSLSQYPDEPNLIQPSGPNYRLWAAIAASISIIGLVVSIPLYQNWQEHQAHDAVRGEYQGATYDIQIDEQSHHIELGWAGSHLAVVLKPALGPDTTVRIQGNFGDDTLSWNEKYSLYGPSQVPLDPYTHHKVELTIESADQVLWSGKLWAWGIHTHHHH
ncbi:hypothetical protein [Cerasicoccus frondis]|uniref:hypothetical protein n=1 Tax=Cerasicoccus frondis TaxID=490090 RepID=UPI002852B54C|nr:hypothetical protein [Cerasicoccus frondis]